MTNGYTGCSCLPHTVLLRTRSKMKDLSLALSSPCRVEMTMFELGMSVPLDRENTELVAWPA